MRIALLLFVLAPLLVAGQSQAYVLLGKTFMPHVECSTTGNIVCVVCLDGPDEGPLPVSIELTGGTGVGIALEPGDYVGFISGESTDFGPYTGVFVRPRCGA